MITFNHEKYIAEAIEGVLMQETNFDIELIISDDASTDNTESVVNDFIVNHPRGNCIRYFRHPKNLGMIPNFVWSLQQCKGEMIALCEGDDYWTDSNKLQEQFEILESNEQFSGVFHETQVVIEPERTTGVVYGRSAPDLCTTLDTISTGSLFHTSSFFFKKSCYNIPDWFTNIVSGDMALFSIVSKEGILKKIPKIMSVYRKHSEGVTATPFVTRSFHQDRVRLIKYLDSYHKHRFKRKAMEVIKYHQAALGHNNNRIVGKSISRAIKYLRNRIRKFLS